MLYGTNGWSEWEDDGEEGLARQRVLSESEVIARLARRPEVLLCDRERLTKGLVAGCLAAGLLVGLWLQGLQFAAHVAEAWRAVDLAERNVRVVDAIDRPDRPRPHPDQPVRRTMSRVAARHTGTPGRRPGGSSRARMRTMGVFQYAASHAGPGAATMEAMRGMSSIAISIDRLFQGKRFVAASGGGGAGRVGVQQIGFDLPGNDGGSVEALFNALAQPEPATVRSLKHRVRDRLKPTDPVGSSGRYLGSNGRSRSDIMKVVYQNISGLRYIYSSWLRGRPGLKGKVTVTFAIDEFGKVISVFVIESTLRDEALEKAIVDQIRTWRFDKIDKPGDITEVIHPFMFST